jgi:hypothetical protein
MPQRIFHNQGETSTMAAFVKVIFVIVLAVACFGLGWFTSNSGYRVVDSTGNTVVKSNAAQIVKDENARLGRDVIGKTEDEARQLLEKNNRTMFVGVRDGKAQEYKVQKTFTNLTVETKDNKVVKVLGWY